MYVYLYNSSFRNYYPELKKRLAQIFIIYIITVVVNTIVFSVQSVDVLGCLFHCAITSNELAGMDRISNTMH